MSEQLISDYFHADYTYEEICEFLLKYYEISISIRQLHRVLKNLGLKRKNYRESQLESICTTFIQELDEDGCCLGYRSLWKRLRQKYGLNVKRETVYKCLKLYDPDGLASRRINRLRRRQYISPGPNFLWHVDGYDKLKPYGFAIHGCIDGFSRKILWLKVATSNNNPSIIAHYYLETITDLQLLPTMIRSDLGTENCFIDLSR